ncbi:MAG: valine--tRNA ligase [Candidatus Omnitrophica bacterium]|nr:valine--tRNA ligase [Candidatus Omnitrophota bacterium]
MEMPAQYNPKEVEEKAYRKWAKEKLFAASVAENSDPFSIVIPPPNVTGILHMGHALNSTIQDVMIRFKGMKGCQSLWMPGTDHAGIATQNVVERNLAKDGLKKEDLGRDKFNEKLWEWTNSHGSTIISQLKRLGAACDWDRTRFTMDDAYSDAIKEVFVTLYEKGLIYKGNYIINWCPRCKTALSDEESPHRDIDGWLYYIKYPVSRPEADNQKAESYIVVATTRPETMLGDTAVAINPNDSRYDYLKGSDVILPIVNRKLRVIEDEAVDPEFGTGIVKVTPAHDPIDFAMGKKHNLEFINIMNADATLNDNATAMFAGMDRFRGRQALLDILYEKKLIEKKEPYKIAAGHCYRCNTIIEPWVSAQWFVKMKPLAQKAIKVVEDDEVKFYPPRWKKVYLNWMYDIHDWCISRQIWWGHRLPVYYCKQCLNQTGNQTIDHRQQIVDQNSKTKNNKESNVGIIVSRDTPDKCPSCGGSDLVQEEDVLDTWFSSWLWPFATFYWPFGKTIDHRPQTIDLETKREELSYFYPTNILVTASEILFFWVARMIMAGMEFMGEIPFRDVLIHGTVRDEYGVKMSKSLGNTIDPLEIIDKFGADALRFSLMFLAASGSDIYLSEEKFLIGRNFCNKIYNSARFLFLKIKENNLVVDNLNLDSLNEIDRWVLKELNQTIEEASKYLESYRINEATKRVYDFFWHTFCDWYLEIVKDDFTLPKAKVLIHTLISTLKMLHPIMPFITEEIFEAVGKNTKLTQESSIMVASWPRKTELNIDARKEEITKSLFNTIKEMRNIKTDLGLGTKKVKLKIKITSDTKDVWAKNESWIKRLTILDTIEICEDLNRVLYRNDFWELNFDIDDIDKSTFVASLDKKINHAKGFLSKVSKKLENKRFIENAPGDTVEKERLKFKQTSAQKSRLQELRDAFK